MTYRYRPRPRHWILATTVFASTIGSSQSDPLKYLFFLDFLIPIEARKLPTFTGNAGADDMSRSATRLSVGQQVDEELIKPLRLTTKICASRYERK